MTAIALNEFRANRVENLKAQIFALKKEIREAQAIGCKSTADLLTQDLAFLEDDLHFTRKAIEDDNG